jgi:hypothetical protein
MDMKVNETAWNVSSNRLPARIQSEDKRNEISGQVNKLLELNVVKPSQATAHSFAIQMAITSMATHALSSTMKHCLSGQ